MHISQMLQGLNNYAATDDLLILTKHLCVSELCIKFAVHFRNDLESDIQMRH